MASLTFEQIPAKLEYLSGKVEDLERLLFKLSDQLPKTLPTKPRRLTLDQLCEKLPWRPARATVYGMVSRREIPFEKNGKYLQFREDEIDKWLDQRAQSHGYFIKKR
jgi:excisionase family DNA binding protein